MSPTSPIGSSDVKRPNPGKGDYLKRIGHSGHSYPLSERLRLWMQRDTKNFANRGSTELAMLNVRDLEAFLKIDQKTIYRYVALGLIPYVRIQSNIRFVKEQIERWIEEQSYRPRNGGNQGPTHEL